MGRLPRFLGREGDRLHQESYHITQITNRLRTKGLVLWPAQPTVARAGAESVWGDGRGARLVQ